eukprot:CAMPEP_0196827554 /NCGR_PEP_ID=MMETSP1362-20130617/94219_1 /TAXON_ID=163516 /ORGANISM="Leptocylindrus danicus, Strain CCMP1856" /LENGTH=614 /DNA_ID=CAMNT_0042208195 /DNA_START=807 /DNA_END=2651 /DNA_ORIENTATION=+
MFIENVQSGASDELGNSPILQIQAEECTPVCEGDCDTVCLRFSPSNTTYVSCVAECLLVTGVKGEVRMWTCERKKDSDVDVIRINLQRVFSVSSSSVVTCLCWVYPTINGVDLCGSTSNGTLYFWGSSGECNGTTDWNLVLAYEHSNAPINHIAVCSHGEASYLQSEQSVHESEDAARRRGLILTGDLFGCIRLYRPDLLAKEGVDSVGSVGTLNQTPSSVGDGFSSRSPSLPPLFELVAEIKLNSACRGFFVSKEVNDADGDCFITIASEFGEIKQFDEQRLPIRQPSLPSAAADIGEDFESDLIDAHKSIARLSEYVMQESSMGEEASTVEKCPVLEPEPPLDGESSSCPAPRSPLHLSFESIDDGTLQNSGPNSTDLEARTFLPIPHVIEESSQGNGSFTRAIEADLETVNSSKSARDTLHHNDSDCSRELLIRPTINNHKETFNQNSNDDDSSSNSNEAYARNPLSTTTLHSTLIYQELLKERNQFPEERVYSKATNPNLTRATSGSGCEKRNIVYKNLTQINDKESVVNDCKDRLHRGKSRAKKSYSQPGDDGGPTWEDLTRGLDLDPVVRLSQDEITRYYPTMGVMDFKYCNNPDVIPDCPFSEFDYW